MNLTEIKLPNAILTRSYFKFCKLMLDEIVPEKNSWVGNVITAPWNEYDSDWWFVRETVRKISEGLNFVPTISALTISEWDKFEKDCKSK